MTAPRLGSCTLPPLNAELDGLWPAILDLAEDLSAEGWVLVGGQMVMLHGLMAWASRDPGQVTTLICSPI